MVTCYHEERSYLSKPKKRKLTESKKLKKECDDLWSKIILKRAGYKSEISNQEGKQIGGEHTLHPHHIARKPNNRLRYEPENGICLTAWEHKYGIHGDHEERYRVMIKSVKGQDIYERMALLRNAKSLDLRTVKIYLEQELKNIS